MDTGTYYVDESYDWFVELYIYHYGSATLPDPSSAFDKSTCVWDSLNGRYIPGDEVMDVNNAAMVIYTGPIRQVTKRPMSIAKIGPRIRKVPAVWPIACGTFTIKTCDDPKYSLWNCRMRYYDPRVDYSYANKWMYVVSTDESRREDIYKVGAHTGTRTALYNRYVRMYGPTVVVHAMARGGFVLEKHVIHRLYRWRVPHANRQYLSEYVRLPLEEIMSRVRECAALPEFSGVNEVYDVTHNIELYEGSRFLGTSVILPHHVRVNECVPGNLGVLA